MQPSGMTDHSQGMTGVLPPLDQMRGAGRSGDPTHPGKIVSEIVFTRVLALLLSGQGCLGWLRGTAGSLRRVISGLTVCGERV